jgi:hypothetical protein
VDNQKEIVMKKLITLGMCIGLGLFGVGAANAGTFDTATAADNDVGVTVITPIAIANTVPLHFGEIVGRGTAGTVVMTPASARSSTGGTYLGNDDGHAASFTVTGEGSSTYSITLPADGVVEIDDAGEGVAMDVDTFKSTPETTGTLTGGTQTLTVGATLDVGEDQLDGEYTGHFNVIVTYN